VLSLIDVESRFDPQAISPKGARGLMQLLPATAARYGMHALTELHDPQRNIDLGVRHLKDLLQSNQDNWALALAAYNAGNGAVQRGQRIPAYRETMLYVPAVLVRAHLTSQTTP
jgi:soluble lytic murein transglycosylase-like protein